MRKRKIEEIKDRIDTVARRMMAVSAMSDEELRETMRSPIADVRTIANNEAARRWAETIMTKGDR